MALLWLVRWREEYVEFGSFDWGTQLTEAARELLPELRAYARGQSPAFAVL
jgi:hypothetical protein